MLFDCCKKTFNYSDLKRCIAKADGSPLIRLCKECISNNTHIPDVYYNYPSGINYEENIADPKTGKPIPFYDKQSKVAAMKIADVREAGDRIHGARNEDGLHRKTYFST